MTEISSKASRRNLVLTFGAATVTPVLYLVFVNQYAVNSFYDDDWSVTPMLRAALNGHLSLGQVWAQHFESRLLMGNLVDLFFAHVDHFNMRAIILLSAGLFILSYVILLLLFRRYLDHALTPIPVLAFGATWFSLADVQNSLWAFQVSWYLTVLFFVLMLFALQGSGSRRRLYFALAAGAAVAASLSTVQGFLCWPIGAIAFLWTQPWTRRAFRETAVWCAVAVVTLVLYLYGYKSSITPCHPTCSAAATLQHPATGLGFFLALLGDVVPGRVDLGGPLSAGGGYGGMEILGLALLIVSCFIVVQSWRNRAASERYPLPLLLIAFSLLFDVTIALGRGAGGQLALGNRYVMPNLMLLTGIVIYASAHIPVRRTDAAHSPRKARLNALAFIGLALFLVVQVTGATEFGLTNGQKTSTSRMDQARLAVNLHRLPADAEWRCEVFAEFQFQPSWSLERVSDAMQSHLGEFEAVPYRHNREEGPPPLIPNCRHFAGSLPPPK